MTDLDIILPCYNPTKGWTSSIISSYQKLAAAMPGKNIKVIIVNDGSSKGVQEEDVQTLKAHLPLFSFISYANNRGKGHALRQGVQESTAPYAIYTDIDFPYEEDNLIEVWRLLESDQFDVIAGVRDNTYYAEIPQFRLLISKFLKFMIRFMLHLPTNDTQCGLKGFNAKGRALFLSTTIDRYLFDLEFIFLAGNTKAIRIATPVVQLKQGIVFSKMRINVLLKEAGNFSRILYKRVTG